MHRRRQLYWAQQWGISLSLIYITWDKRGAVYSSMGGLFAGTVPVIWENIHVK